MGMITKKLRILNRSGTTQLAALYTNPGEAGAKALPLWVDNANVYAPLVSTSSPLATSARVTDAAGNTWAIGTYGTPDYGRALYTSSGSFTVPEGVTKVRVTLVAGGGGGSYVNGGWGVKIPLRYGSDGGNSSFGTLASVTGGKAGGTGYESQGGGYGYFYARPGAGGSPGGTQGRTCYNLDKDYYKELNCSTEWVDGENGYTIYDIFGNFIGSYGASGGRDLTWGALACCGGSGGRAVKVLSVGPGDVYAVTVGAGGQPNPTYSESGAYAGPGQNGAVMVEWGKGVE